MELKAERVRMGSGCADRVREIYFAAFPKKERMAWWLMLLLSTLPGCTELLAFKSGDTVCGMIYMATLGRLSFIMFFAVDEKLRSKGYGSQILAAVQERHPRSKKVVSIEPCDESAPDIELRRRRKAFYQRNGYAESGYMMRLGGGEQEILVKGGEFKKGAFLLFMGLYSFGAALPRVYKKALAAK